MRERESRGEYFIVWRILIRTFHLKLRSDTSAFFSILKCLDTRDGDYCTRMDESERSAGRDFINTSF